jgi:hypothetical protein
MRFVFLSPADPQPLVVPQTAATFQTDGKMQTAPFNIPSRYQQVYDKSEFVAIKTPLRITELAFRPVEDQQTQGHKIERIQIRLSTFKQSSTELSTIFDKNVGRDEVVVFEGPLTLRTRMRRSRGSTLQCDIAVPLSKPFVYNPAEGSLLLEIRNYSGANATFYVNGCDGPSIRIVYADALPNRVGAGIIQNGGMVTQLTFAPVTK